MSIKKDGLTLEQWKAANIFAVGEKVSNKHVANKCNVSVDTIKSWRRDPLFNLAILRMFEKNMAEFRSVRIGKMSKFLSKLYKQAEKQIKKVEQGEYEYSLKELMNIITKLHGEVRQDHLTFSSNKKLLAMLAEFTGRDPETLGVEDFDEIGTAESKYMSMRAAAKQKAEDNVVKMSDKKRKRKTG